MKNKLNSKKGLLVLLMCFCCLLYLIRIKVSHSLFFGFLIWNLFLAFVPYCISLTIQKIKLQLSRFKTLVIIIIWLLFLPNAPYIITDFIHLNPIKSNLIWLDIFILFSFSITGLLFAILSMQEIHEIIKEKWNLKTANYSIFTSAFLTGFGIYLGRFLRFNTWDIISSPKKIILQSFYSINDTKTWFITLSFGSFLYLLFCIFKKLKQITIFKTDV